MDIAFIQKRIDAVCKVMSAKGLREPEVEFGITSNCAPGAHARWTRLKKSGAKEWEYEWFKADTAAELLDKADAWVASLPNPDETRMKEFMSALGAVIDLGRQNGIDVEFVNPLVATMKSLSENVITHQRGAA